MTHLEGISDISWDARTRWNVIDHITLGILTTNANARVSALVVNACLVLSTIRAVCTLWATAFVGISIVVCDTFASSSSLSLNAFGIGSTGRRLTWVDGLALPQYALYEWISGIVLQADTRHGMAYDPAFGVNSAGARTRVPTLLIDACLIALAL